MTIRVCFADPQNALALTREGAELGQMPVDGKRLIFSAYSNGIWYTNAFSRVARDKSSWIKLKRIFEEEFSAPTYEALEWERCSSPAKGLTFLLVLIKFISKVRM